MSERPIYSHWPTALTLALVAGLPLLSYPFSWFLPGWTAYRSPLLVPLVVLAAVGAWIGLARGVLVTMNYRRLWPATAVLLTTLVSTRFSEHPELSLAGLPTSVSLLVVLLMATQVRAESFARITQVWVVVVLIVAVNGLARLGLESEFVSTVGNRNLLAVSLATAVPLAWTLRDRRWRLAIVPVLVGMWLCHSRGAWLALAAGVVAVWTVRKATGYRLAIIGAVILVGGIMFTRPWTDDVRPAIWRATAKMALTQPWAGHGPGTFLAVYPQFRDPTYFQQPKAAAITDHAHNELLELAAEQGWPGLAAMLWLVATCLWLGARDARELPGKLGFLGATVILLCHSLLDITSRVPPTQGLLWLSLGLLAAPTAGETTRKIERSVGLAVTGGAIAIWLFIAGFWQPVRTDWHDRAARLASIQGDPARAIAEAERALQIQPHRLSTRYFLAGVLASVPTRAAQQAAIAQCELLRIYAPDYADVTFNLANLYVTQGHPAPAIPLLDHVLQSNPHHDRALSLRQTLDSTAPPR